MPITITTLNTLIEELFDTLINTAGSTTNTLLPVGWEITETGGGARDNEQYGVDTGSSNTGDTYSYGTAGSTDRALGQLRSGTAISTIGSSFTNGTGSTITSLLISYFAEQWRVGTANRADRMDFQISFDATSLTTGTWTDVDALDLISPNTTGTAGARDGNAAANRVQVTSTIAGLNIPAGATFWIRWVDTDASGADDGLGIDNFQLTALGAAPSPGELAIDSASIAEGNSGTTNITFTVTRSGGSAGAVAATWTATFAGGAGNADASDFNPSQLFTGTVNFADGETSRTITLAIAGDTVTEPNENFTVVLSDPTGGATITTAVGNGAIINDDSTPGTLTIDNVSVTEGNAGTTDMVFTVTRSGGSTGAVGASWSFTHTTTSNDDFSPFVSSGTVAFADGQTTATITLTVAGDTTFEGNETFNLDLFNPTGGVTISDNQADGTILNDDAAPPVGTLSIDDVSVVEGNSGTTNLTFTVSRASGSSGAVGATWTLTNGTTNAGDFATATFTGTVSFADGQTNATIVIPVAGDTTFEANETFTVTLSSPTGGVTIADAAGTGTITNDDAAPAIANVWINEIHYDNAGADVGEAVEVAGLAGTDLTGWSLVLYNGNGGANYATVSLSGIITDQNNGHGTISAAITGAQNGAPDGIALVDNFGRVVQFLSYEGTMTATAGPAIGLTSSDIGVSEEPAPAAGLSLQLIGTGSSYADFTWVAGADDNFGAVNTGQTFLSTTGPSQFRVADAQVVEGNSATSTLTFIVYRAGGLSNAAAVDFAISLDGTANAADIGAGATFTGTVSFAAGESQRTIQIPVQGDVAGEPNETLNITLSNPSGLNTISDAQAVGTIVNDDPVPLTIMQIQGESHRSAYVGQPVLTTGIVTAVAATGFYLQDAAGDGNARTSDAIFVFTTTAPTVAVGDSLSVSGTVSEFTGAAGALSLTQITAPSITVVSSGNALPTAVLLGQGGILPPTEWIDDDGLLSYNPDSDGADFWESLEGMRVTLDTPQAVSNNNGFGETYVVASGGNGASGVNASGGITISANSAAAAFSQGDFNPEMIQIDNDATIFAGFTPAYTVGDRLSNVTGIVNYAFGAYEVIPTQAVTVTSDVTIARETTTLNGTPTGLTIATYNVENLDPTDNRFNLLANDIVFSLQAPDIIGLQEIQDADGTGTGSNLSGAVTAQLLIDAIVAAGGPTYTYIEVAPTVANTTGGEPNGNIRPGFLYDASRVTYVAGSLTQITNVAFNNSRSPLVASFAFNGQVVTAINVHLTSRGGSEDLWGANQPAANGGEASRTAQIAAVNAYVNNHLATNPAYDVVLMGDFNGFYFEAEQRQLVENGGVLFNVGVANLPEEERFSYLFEGNSQLLDNIYASARLMPGSSYDAVHINALFDEATRPTDHDPQLAMFAVAAGTTLFGDEFQNVLVGGSGNDSVFGLDQDDELHGMDGSDRLVGAAGNDYLAGGNGADFLWGGTGNDLLFGGAGTDMLDGGAGNDGYYVGTGDTIVELAGGGSDIAYADSDYVLGAGVEVEILGTVNELATTAINLTGNNLNNYLSGNAGANTLDGGTGSDILWGRGGDDVYIVDADDLVVEYAGQGNDRVNARESFILYDGIEVETLAAADAASTVALNLTGNSLDNHIIGNAGANILNGGGGDDVFEGGLGDDSYYYVTAGDAVIENLGGGYDIVYADGDYTLSAGAEIEILGTIDNLATTTIDLTGNELNNYLSGNAGVNVLEGGAGSDYLLGRDGNDVFAFLANSGADTVLDFTRGQDQIDLSTLGLSFAQIQAGYVQQGIHGVINLGNGNSVTLLNITLADLTETDFILAPAAAEPLKVVAANALDLGNAFVVGAEPDPEVPTVDSLLAVASVDQFNMPVRQEVFI